MPSIEDKLPKVPISKGDDDIYYSKISELITKERLSGPEREVLTVIKEDMELRYLNFKTSKTYQTIRRSLENPGIGMTSIEKYDPDWYPNRLSDILICLEDSGIISDYTQKVLFGRIDELNSKNHREYWLDR